MRTYEKAVPDSDNKGRENMVHCDCEKCGYSGELEEMTWCTGGTAYFCGGCHMAYTVDEDDTDNKGTGDQNDQDK